jgi:hypothetical protein
VGPLSLVQLQRPGEGVQDAVGDAVQVPSLHLGVIVDAHSGQQRHLLAAQAGNPPVAAVGGQAGLLGSDPGPPGSQEVPNLGAVVHAVEATSRWPLLGGAGSTWINRHSHRRGIAGLLFQGQPQATARRRPLRATLLYGAGDVRVEEALARACIEELLPDVLEGRIQPGRVFDRTICLDEVPDGYRAMADRQALKVLIQP